MFIKHKSEAPNRIRNGLISHVLLEKGDISGSQLVVTWVDVEPDSTQQSHHHKPEQVYIIVRGRGQMQVEEEGRDVSEGDLIHIPSMAIHSIRNTSTGILSYVAVSTPAFDIKSFYDKGHV
jgi:mannose-6-phosphate isomerase-like protein (cupin superfamily)